MILFGLFHIAFATLIAYLMATLFGGLALWSAIFSLVLGSLIALFAKKKFAAGFDEVRVSKFGTGISGIFEGALFVYLGFAAYKHFAWMLFPSDNNWKTLSLNNYGDLPLHLNYIRFFAQGASFPPINPIFPTEPLRYPLGIDLYSALWEIAGVPSPSHLFLLGIFAFLASFAVLRVWAGWLAIAGFFLNGGLLGFELLGGHQINYALEGMLGWKNIFLTVFITQRGMLFALPVGLLLLHFARRVVRGEQNASSLQLQLAGILWGSLALFHLHTFFIVSLILAGFVGIYWRREIVLRLKPVLYWALPIGSLFTLHSTGFLQKAGVVRWHWGWMAGNEGFFKFAALNFGIWPLVVLAAGIILWRKRQMAEFKEWVLAFALFALFLNLMVAPWEWDNIKVLIWPYLLLIAAMNFALQTFPQRIRIGIEPVLAVVLFFSGIVLVTKTLGRATSAPAMMSIESLAKTEGAIKNVPKDAVFVAAATHDHALAWLGRARVLGYEGHIWSHGINSSSQQADLQKVVHGEESWLAAAQRLKATHIFWGPQEMQVFGPMPETVKNVSRNISSVPGYEVYELPKN